MTVSYSLLVCSRSSAIITFQHFPHSLFITQLQIFTMVMVSCSETILTPVHHSQFHFTSRQICRSLEDSDFAAAVKFFGLMKTIEILPYLPEYRSHRCISRTSKTGRLEKIIKSPGYKSQARAARGVLCYYKLTAV